jgi:hypothetical protein
MRNEIQLDRKGSRSNVLKIKPFIVPSTAVFGS